MGSLHKIQFKSHGIRNIYIIIVISRIMKNSTLEELNCIYNNSE